MLPASGVLVSKCRERPVNCKYERSLDRWVRRKSLGITSAHADSLSVPDVEVGVRVGPATHGCAARPRYGDERRPCAIA